MYQVLRWLFRVPYIYPTPILNLAYHLTVPTRVDGSGVCFVRDISSVSAKNLPLIFFKAVNWWPLVALLTICEYGANKFKNNILKKHYDIPVLFKNSHRCSGMSAHVSRGPTPSNITSPNQIWSAYLSRVASGGQETPKHKRWEDFFSG